MSVGVHAVAKVAELKPGSNVVVFGAGPVGLLTAAAAKGLGAARVIAVGMFAVPLPTLGERTQSSQRLLSSSQTSRRVACNSRKRTA